VRLRVEVVGLALAALLWIVPAAAAQTAPASSGAASPDPQAVARAIEQVKADPNLNSTRTIRYLRWRREPPKNQRMPDWLRWLSGLFRWIAESARVLVWVAAGILAGLLAVYIVRALQARGDLLGAGGFVAPTHVRDLDIRPESLPVDIGAAARALWDRGEHRAALALLYRGLLSRLAHVHSVPIRDSTTEGSCLTLAAMHLPEARHEYVSTLVRVWQRAVYGGQDAETPAVYALCAGFSPALDPAPAAAVSERP
jgi:hypothetical protein